MAVHNLDSATLIGAQVWLYEWTAVANGDTGEPVELNNLVDLTVTIDGTFSTGGSCTFEGSNDGTNYYALTDSLGDAITLTAAGMKIVTEAPRYVRPDVTAGDGSTAIDIRLVARRGSR